jgi:hypothetical protein
MRNWISSQDYITAWHKPIDESPPNPQEFAPKPIGNVKAKDRRDLSGSPLISTAVK